LVNELRVFNKGWCMTIIIIIDQVHFLQFEFCAKNSINYPCLLQRGNNSVEGFSNPQKGENKETDMS